MITYWVLIVALGCVTWGWVGYIFWRDYTGGSNIGAWAPGKQKKVYHSALVKKWQESLLVCQALLDTACVCYDEGDVKGAREVIEELLDYSGSRSRAILSLNRALLERDYNRYHAECVKFSGLFSRYCDKATFMLEVYS